MAGGHGFHALKHNVHIDRYAAMRDNVVGTFKWTRKNTIQTLFGLLIVPVGLLWIATIDANKWDLRGKQRGQSLLRYPLPATASPAADEEE